MVDSVIKLKGVIPKLPDENVLDILGLEELKDDVANAPELDSGDQVFAQQPQKQSRQPITRTLTQDPEKVSTTASQKKNDSFRFTEKIAEWKGTTQYNDAAQFLSFDHTSSFVGNVVYEKADKSLQVVLGDAVYNFCGVSRSVYDGFRNASSKGKYFNRVMKGQFNC